MAKIPADAYSMYLGMGANRSYEGLASRLGCSKKAIAKRAIRERWQERIAESERKVQVSAEARVIEDMGSVVAKQLKIIRFVQARAVEKLKQAPIASSRDAFQALAMSLREERLLTGLEEKREEELKPKNDNSDIFRRWFDESPSWQSQAIARVERPGEKNAGKRRITNLLSEIAFWLNTLAGQGLLESNQPLHQILLEAFRVEPEEYKSAEMSRKVIMLADAFEQHAREDGIDDRSPYWSTFMVRPGDATGQKLQWREAFSLSPGNSPIAYVSHCLRTKPELSHLRTLVPAAAESPIPPQG